MILSYSYQLLQIMLCVICFIIGSWLLQIFIFFYLAIELPNLFRVLLALILGFMKYILAFIFFLTGEKYLLQYKPEIILSFLTNLIKCGQCGFLAVILGYIFLALLYCFVLYLTFLKCRGVFCCLLKYISSSFHHTYLFPSLVPPTHTPHKKGA